jgi:hypothetical protein
VRYAEQPVGKSKQNEGFRLTTAYLVLVGAEISFDNERQPLGERQASRDHLG